MFDKLGLVMIVVSDMSRSIEFYRDVLGLNLQFETPRWTEFDVGGVKLALHIEGPHLTVNPQGGVGFGFYVDDIESTLAELSGRGARVVHKSQEEFGILALVPDPDGYVVQLCQPKA